MGAGHPMDGALVGAGHPMDGAAGGCWFICGLFELQKTLRPNLKTGSHFLYTHTYTLPPKTRNCINLKF